MTAMRKPAGVPVKISAANHLRLQEWAAADDRPMGEIVNELIERYDRERFWQTAREQLARLKDDPVAWRDYLDEVEEFDVLVGDGLENEAPYYSVEEVREIIARARIPRNG